MHKNAKSYQYLSGKLFFQPILSSKEVLTSNYFLFTYFKLSLSNYFGSISVLMYIYVGTYFNCIMFMVASSVVTTIMILNYHHRQADTHQMPAWVSMLADLSALLISTRKKSVFRISPLKYYLYGSEIIWIWKLPKLVQSQIFIIYNNLYNILTLQCWKFPYEIDECKYNIHLLGKHR